MLVCYFGFMIGKDYGYLNNIYFVFILVCYFVFMICKVYGCLNNIYFAFLFSNVYIRLLNIYFVLLLVYYFGFLIGKVYDCLNNIYFVFLFSNDYIRLKSIYFVLLFVCYFGFLINNKTYRQIELSTGFQDEFRKKWGKWDRNIMYKGIETGRRKCVASCTFRRLFFKSAHKGYLPTKVGEISSQLRY